MADTFLSWRRSMIYRLATGGVAGGRLQAALPVTLVDALAPGNTRSAGAPFELLGPGDTTGLAAPAITARIPAPGASDAPETKMAHIEFAEPDLPWRYTPKPTTEDLRPWLVLVVGLPGVEVILRPRGRVTLTGAVLGAHNLGNSNRWAHVHEKADGNTSRIVSPRDLKAGTDYLAVLVPAYRIEGAGAAAQIVDAWGAGTVEVTLPCFDQWRFRTGAEGDFAQIAQRLEPVKIADLPAGFGVAHVWFGIGPPPAGQAGAEVRGALARVLLGATPGDAQPLGDQEVTDRITALTDGVPPVAGRWVLTLPDYAEPWPPPAGEPGPPANDVGWRNEFRTDPRRRGIAGLGAWGAIEWQQRIADAAAAQAGALAIAAQRIAYLTFGLAGTRALWNNRLPAAGNALERLAVIAPSLSRIPAGASNVLNHVSGRTPRLAPELFSTAARRVLRPGPARTQLAAPGASDFAEVLKVAGRCPPKRAPDKLTRWFEERRGQQGDRRGAFERLVREARDQASEFSDDFLALIGTLPGWVIEGMGAPPPDLIAALAGIDGTFESIVRLREAIAAVGREPDPDAGNLIGLFEWPREQDDCRPVNMEDLAGRVIAAVDPTVPSPLIVDRVLSTLTGLREPRLAPPDLSPELDFPMWKFLEERARDWLLPGVADLPVDRVVAMSTNRVFVDSFLVGANVQTLGELRWRNIPITSSWTPLRRFWERIHHEDSVVATDIRSIGAGAVPGWSKASPLGDASHTPVGLPQGGENLVIVFHTSLFRRYPATLVYLAKANADGMGGVEWKNTPQVDTDPKTQRVPPILTGRIGPDVVFFGFPVPPSAGLNHWVVLEEPPPGTRFYTEAPFDPATQAGQIAIWNQKRDNAASGAAFAEATFARPVRVFLGRLLDE